MNTGFRAGQWVVHNDKVGLLFRRDEFHRNDRGQVIDDNGEVVDTSDGIALARAPRDLHIDFHPVDDNGETVTSAIVPDVILGVDKGGTIEMPKIGAGRSVHGVAPIGMRAAHYTEIPTARQAGDNGTGDARAFHRFGYEGAPVPADGEPSEPEAR